jgi:hypothetical protein
MAWSSMLVIKGKSGTEQNGFIKGYDDFFL